MREIFEGGVMAKKKKHKKGVKKGETGGVKREKIVIKGVTNTDDYKGDAYLYPYEKTGNPEL